MEFLTKDSILLRVKQQPGENILRVPDGITEIAPCACFGQAWQQILLPESLEVIERSAFEGCHTLWNLHLSENLCYLGSRAFADCTALKALRLPDSLTDIGLQAISGCTALEDLWIPMHMLSPTLLFDTKNQALRRLHFRYLNRDVSLERLRLRDWETVYRFMQRPGWDTLNQVPPALRFTFVAQLGDLIPELFRFGYYTPYGVCCQLIDNHEAELLCRLLRSNLLTDDEEKELLAYSLKQAQHTGDAQMQIVVMRELGITEDGIGKGKFRL